MKAKTPRSLVLLSFVLAACASSREVLAPGLAEGDVATVERPGDGSPVCGLGKAFHGGRRAELMRRQEEKLMVFRGLPETRDYLAFRQDKTFWYLTGVESPNAALVLDAKSGREILFLPPRDERGERWEGEKWDSSDEWVKDLTGFEEVREIDALVDTLKELLDGRGEIGISLHPWLGLSAGYDRAQPYHRHQAKDPLDGRTSREEALAAKLAELLGVETFDLADELIDMRRIKTPEEVAAMRRAARSGALAMAEAMRSTRPGLGEWELDSLMSFVQIREGAAGPAYHAIVGSGGNSCVLHYSASSRRMQKGEVVLIDYGSEVDHYTTDITRTWPVDGEFSPAIKKIYDVVLEAQLAAIAAVKPGVTLRDVGKVANDVYEKHGLEGLRLHGTCHFIGMEVHDPGAYSQPVEAGVAFTVEPGLYDPETGIGVRIEDVVVVTETGCEVITDLVPKSPDEVRKTVLGTGVIDWMDEVGG